MKNVSYQVGVELYRIYHPLQLFVLLLFLLQSYNTVVISLKWRMVLVFLLEIMTSVHIIQPKVQVEEILVDHWFVIFTEAQHFTELFLVAVIVIHMIQM